MPTFKKIHVGPVTPTAPAKHRADRADTVIPTSVLAPDFTNMLVAVSAMDAAQISSLSAAIQARIKVLNHTMPLPVPGTRVSFNAGKRRGTLTGSVTGVRGSKVLVQVDADRRTWRVPPALLVLLKER